MPAMAAAEPAVAEAAGAPVAGEPEGSMTGGVMRNGASQNGGGQGGEIVAKVKQVKTKVTERPGKDGGPPSWQADAGSARGMVYVTTFREKEFYTISYWVDGKRVRRVYPTKGKAIHEAKEAGKKLGKGVAAAAEMSSADWSSMCQARELVAPYGLAVETAGAIIAHILGRLAGRGTPDQAIDCFLKYHPAGMEQKRVAAVVKECLEAKRQDGLSARYLRQFEYDLNRFKGTFKNYIGDVSGVMIDDCLRKLKLAPRTRNNLRTSVQTLFNYAKSRRYPAKDHDERSAVSLAKDADGEIEIFRPSELQSLLRLAKPELVPALVIGAFAGVRHEEIQRLDWQDIKLKAGIIEIRAAKAKTASRRTIPIVPNLKAWLLARGGQAEREALRAGTRSGPVCPFLDFTRQLLKLAKAVGEDQKAAGNEISGQRDHEVRNQENGFRWKHNRLRHSFISYRVAAVKNVNQVAMEAGLSPQMIFKRYRELVTPQEAKA